MADVHAGRRSRPAGSPEPSVPAGARQGTEGRVHPRPCDLPAVTACPAAYLCRAGPGVAGRPLGVGEGPRKPSRGWGPGPANRPLPSTAVRPCPASIPSPTHVRCSSSSRTNPYPVRPAPRAPGLVSGQRAAWRSRSPLPSSNSAVCFLVNSRLSECWRPRA